MRKQLEQGGRAAFDREMHLAELFSPTTAATLRFRGESYGADQNSRYELYLRDAVIFDWLDSYLA
jgi:hypothetical protein